jgi:hypothetical protein
LFDWKVARGYDVKDAAAFALHDPSGISVIKECCIVHLQTNVDTDADLVARMNLKHEIEAKAAQARADAGLPPIQREVVKLYCSNAQRNVQGQFILEDAAFEDPTMLAPNPTDILSGNRGRGFVITNIEAIPDRIIMREGWRTFAPVIALWSGNIKIIPVIINGMHRIPGVIWAQSPPDANGVHDPDRDFIIRSLDKSFLQAEIISYDIEEVELVNPFDPKYNAVSLQHVITVRKEFVQNIIV